MEWSVPWAGGQEPRSPGAPSARRRQWPPDRPRERLRCSAELRYATSARAGVCLLSVPCDSVPKAGVPSDVMLQQHGPLGVGLGVGLGGPLGGPLGAVMGHSAHADWRPGGLAGLAGMGHNKGRDYYFLAPARHPLQQQQQQQRLSGRDRHAAAASAPCSCQRRARSRSLDGHPQQAPPRFGRHQSVDNLHLPPPRRIRVTAPLESWRRLDGVLLVRPHRGRPAPQQPLCVDSGGGDGLLGTESACMRSAWSWPPRCSP